MVGESYGNIVEAGTYIFISKIIYFTRLLLSLIYFFDIHLLINNNEIILRLKCGLNNAYKADS